MKKPVAFELEQTRNAILGALSVDEAERLRPHLRPREFAMSDHVAHPNEVPDEVCFLERGMLSSILPSKHSVGVEVSMVGREGVWDALLALNGVPRLDMVIVQAPGWGWGLPSEVLLQEFRRGGTLQRKILRYLDLFYTHASVAGMCNRLHTIEERLARWLLIVRNGAESDEFEMPSELVAAMLGSRLSGVPIALGVLQQAGLIMADGQVIRLLDVPALERTTCECHALLAERLHVYLNGSNANSEVKAAESPHSSQDAQHMMARPSHAVQR